MKICFPVPSADGLDSQVYGHFGSAPVFLLVDTVEAGVSVIENRDQAHAHGMCNPVQALGGRTIDALVVGGIGAGALTKLTAEGIRVFQASAPTVRQNLERLLANKLREFTTRDCCSGHSSGGGCGR